MVTSEIVDILSRVGLFVNSITDKPKRKRSVVVVAETRLLCNIQNKSYEGARYGTGAIKGIPTVTITFRK